MKKFNYKNFLFISLSFLLVFSIIFGSGFVSANEDILENSIVDSEQAELEDTENEEKKDEKVQTKDSLSFSKQQKVNNLSDGKSSSNSTNGIEPLADEPDVDWSTTETTAGDFVIIGGQPNVDYSFASNILTILTNRTLTLKTTKTTAQRIVVPVNVEANLIFDGVNITTSSNSPFTLTPAVGGGAKAHIILADGSSNTLKGVANYPALRCGRTTTLVIDDGVVNKDSNGNAIVPELGRVPYDVTLMNGTQLKKGDRLTLLDSKNPGTLTTTGSTFAAAIGGGAGEDAGNITINGGIISATGITGNSLNNGGAGIGGGSKGSGGDITINGGTITAHGSYHAAGVGGGYHTSSTPSCAALSPAVVPSGTYGAKSGNITINGGLTYSYGGSHGNAFGDGCTGYNTNDNFKVIMTGGTVLPSSPGGSYRDLGGSRANVYILGGSLKATTFSSMGGAIAYGDMEQKTQVFMTQINLSGYNLPTMLVDDMKIAVNGVTSDYGLPSYTDETGSLYFWLPSSTDGTSTEVRVDVDVLNQEGKVEPMDSFFVTDATQGSLLKQYINFEIDTKDLQDNERLIKKYDGKEFSSEDQLNFLRAILGENAGIPVTHPSNGKLTDASKMTIQSQLLDENLEPVEDAEIVSGTSAGVGKYQLIITSSEYANIAGFKESFWGHRCYYKYAEIIPADSKVTITATREGDSTNADQMVTMVADVAPGNGEATTCAAPSGKVQFYINGKKYGEPVVLVPNEDASGDGYIHSTAQIQWTPTDNGGIYSVDDIQEVTVEYLAGDDTNYTTSEATPVKFKVTPVDQGDEEKGKTPIEVTVDDKQTVDGERIEKVYGDEDLKIELTKGDTDIKPIYKSSDESIATVDEEGNIHIVGVGEVVITATRPGNGAFNESSQTVILEVAKKKIEVESLDILDKMYDGNTEAKIDLDKLILSGVKKEDIEKLKESLEIISKFPSEKVGKYPNASAEIKLSKEFYEKYYFETKTGKSDKVIVEDEASIKIRKIDESDQNGNKVTVEAIPRQKYTGKEIEPELVVKDGEKVLKEGVDYTVEYRDNIEAGTAIAIVKGKGNYTSTIETEFIIYKINIDTDGDGKPDINIDTDNDGEPDINIDTDNDGKPDINIDTDKDGKPDINIDTNGDGKPDINIDTNKDGKPDLNIDTNKDGKPDINIDTDNDGKPDINIDTDNDGKPDINIDTNGDGKPDINIDTNKNGKPDINIDTDKDGKPDLNIDTNKDGKPDLNIDTNGDGKPDLNIDTNKDGKPDINIDTNGDGKPDINIDINGDYIADKNLVKTSDDTSLIVPIMIGIVSLVGIVCLLIIKKKKD